MLNEIDINKPKMKNKPQIIKISDTCFISVIEYEKRLISFYDVILNNGGKENFIGRFPKEDSIFTVLYKDGKILIGGQDYIQNIETTAFTKVFLLYDILDDVCYSTNESNALEFFDSELDSTHIKNKDKSIVRSDCEKMYRLRKK